jgi:Uma2 family endonuclease
MAVFLMTEPEVGERKSPASLKIPSNYPPRGFEFIDGQLVEKTWPGNPASFISTELMMILGRYFEVKPIGVCLPSEAPYACFPNRPNHVRKPHASVFLCNLKTFVPPRYCSTLPPAIVIEYITSEASAESCGAKVKEFLDVGTKKAWVIDLIRKRVTIRRADGTKTEIDKTGEITGEDVLPDFRLPVVTIFDCI